MCRNSFISPVFKLSSICSINLSIYTFLKSWNTYWTNGPVPTKTQLNYSALPCILGKNTFMSKKRAKNSWNILYDLEQDLKLDDLLDWLECISNVSLFCYSVTGILSGFTGCSPKLHNFSVFLSNILIWILISAYVTIFFRINWILRCPSRLEQTSCMIS